MNSKAIAAIAVVAIIAVAGVGVVVINMDNNNSNDGITIVDGAGQTISISEPLTNVAVINTNVPKAMVMLGIDDAISCFYYNTNNHQLGTNAETLAQTETDRNLGTYYTPSVEVLIKYNVQAVICPVSSMTLYSSAERACEQNGITVIRLDCNGDTILSDIQKLSTLFGDPESATTALNDYMSEYNNTIEAVKNAVAGTELYDYLCAFNSRNAIYNTSSAMASLLGNIFAANVTSYTNLSTDSVTNMVTDNTVEAISEHMDKVEVFLMRLGDLDESSADASYNEYVGATNSNKLVIESSPAYQNDRIYVVESDLMSGLYAHIGLVVIAKVVYGVDVEGYSDLNASINAFQEKYGQESYADGAVLVYQYGANHAVGGDNLILSYTAPAATA